MSVFENAIDVVMKHEGGYVDHPSDPGGATNWGVSLRYLKKLGDLDGDGWLEGDFDRDGDVDADDIRLMTSDQAKAIYRTQWWDRNRYHCIESQVVATKVFDLAINMGPRRAHRLVQQAYRAIGIGRLVEDGKLGPRSFAAINAAPEHMLLAAYRSEAAGFYRRLNKPAFIEGWLNRAYF